MNDNLWYVSVDGEPRGLWEQKMAAQVVDELSQQLPDAKITMTRVDSWPIPTPKFIEEGE